MIVDRAQVARIKARAEMGGDYWPASDVVDLATHWEVLADAYEVKAHRNLQLEEALANEQMRRAEVERELGQLHHWLALAGLSQ